MPVAGPVKRRFVGVVGGPANGRRGPVVLVEPALHLDKTAEPLIAPVGGVVTFELTVHTRR